MRQITMPDIPPGNLRDLMQALHQLYRNAGRPSTRGIAKGLNFSHDTIHRILTKTTSCAPPWRKLRDIVEQLAREAPGQDPAAATNRFHELWVAADKEPFQDEEPFSGWVRGRPTQEELILFSGRIGNESRDKGARASISLLDSVPLPRSDPRVRRLLYLLSKTYSSPLQLDAVVDDVGIDRRDIRHGQNLRQMWNDVCEAAVNQGKLRKLVEYAALDATNGTSREAFQSLLDD